LGIGGYTVEIAGPFGDQMGARAVETALISAYRLEQTLCNVNKGHESWRFRALGVPNEFVGRVDQPALDRDTWRGIAKKAGGVIVVNINDCALGDGRRGDLLANVPANAELAERVDRYWQLRGHAERTWVSSPQGSPGLLVSVSGRGAMRMVIASIRIAPRLGAAVAAAQPHGLLAVPLLLNPATRSTLTSCAATVLTSTPTCTSAPCAMNFSSSWMPRVAPSKAAANKSPERTGQRLILFVDQ